MEQVSELKNIDLAIQKIRAQFPILNRELNSNPLVYLDNAASSQKPIVVTTAIDEYYKNYHSNVHRGIHTLSQIATDKFEEAREKLKTFINAKYSREVIFTRGTTEGINLVASSLSHGFLSEGDEILISEMEHHSNIVPWQIAAERTGAKLIVTNVLEDGSLDMEDFEKKLSSKTKLVSIVHISNTLGTINPVKRITEMAKSAGALVLIDGAQSTPHAEIDVQALDCDFYAFSGHKMYGPTGIGILYGKESILNQLPPYQSGGEMIKEVSFKGTTYNELPFKFEAGTPNIAGAIGLGAAVDFINSIGYQTLGDIEDALLTKGHEELADIPGIKFLGTAKSKTSVISFNVSGIHPSDIGTIIDKLGVAVRTGHHCTQPLMDKFNLPGTVRASFAAYNTLEEIDILKSALLKAVKMLS